MKYGREVILVKLLGTRYFVKIRVTITAKKNGREREREMENHSKFFLYVIGCRYKIFVLQIWLGGIAISKCAQINLILNNDSNKWYFDEMKYYVCLVQFLCFTLLRSNEYTSKCMIVNYMGPTMWCLYEC